MYGYDEATGAIKCATQTRALKKHYTPVAFTSKLLGRDQEPSEYMHQVYQLDLGMMKALNREVTVELESKCPWAFEPPVYRDLEMVTASEACQQVFPPSHFETLKSEVFWRRAAKVFEGQEDLKMPSKPLKHGFVSFYNHYELNIQKDGDFYRGWYPSTLGDENDEALEAIGAHATRWRDVQMSPAFQLMAHCAIKCLEQRVGNFEKVVGDYISYGFEAINSILIRQEQEYMERVLFNGSKFAFLYHGIMALPKIEKPCTVYRYLKNASWVQNLALKTGQEFCMKGFVSTSMAPRFVNSPFKFLRCDVWMEIRLPAGTPCALVGGANDEREVLLPPWMTYRLEAKTNLTIEQTISTSNVQANTTVEYWIVSLILKNDPVPNNVATVEESSTATKKRIRTDQAFEEEDETPAAKRSMPTTSISDKTVQ